MMICFYNKRLIVTKCYTRVNKQIRKLKQDQNDSHLYESPFGPYGKVMNIYRRRDSVVVNGDLSGCVPNGTIVDYYALQSW